MVKKAQLIAVFNEKLAPIVERHKESKYKAWGDFVKGLHADGVVTKRQLSRWSNPF